MHLPARLYRVYFYSVVLAVGIVHHAWSALSTCKVTHNTELDDKVSSSWMFKQLTLRVSSSKLDCARLCLINRSCVTFMVNQKSRQCRLHGARITRLNSLVNATGYKSYDTCRAASAFGALCSTTSDCLLSNSVCIGLMCQCSAGWSYSPNDLTCVRECFLYGAEFTPFEHQYIAGNNMAVLTKAAYLEFPLCAAACAAVTAFKCRSIELDYRDMACKLQTVTPYYAPDAFLFLLSYNVTYYQRHCQYGR